MRAIALAITALLFASPVVAQQTHRAGVFDYYVLALSWTPNWCALEGDKRKDDRCRSGTGRGWNVHGLWPQYERGWPQDCRTTHRDPARPETARLSDFMGSPGLAWHQWKKHGRCSGLSAPDYFATTKRALDRVKLPEIFDKLTRDTRLSALVVEEAFLEANPDMRRDMVTVTCKSRAIQEVRICLTKDLEPRRCGADVIRDCTQDNVLITPLR